MKFDKIVFYDTETVGIKNNYIITLAYMYFERGKQPITGMITCNPDYPIAPAASAVNGFTNEDLIDYPLFPEEWYKIEPMFRDAVWIGYNSNKFDQKALNLEFGRYCIPAPHHYNLDVMLIAKSIIPKNKIKAEVQNYKLITLCTHFGIEGESFHTADFDTWGTLEVFKKLRLINKENNGKYNDLFIPIEIEGEYTNCSPKTKYCDDYDY